MRTALLLLLALAVAAVPGSLVPQRSADPNGVIQFLKANPRLGPILDNLQAFDVYTSVWFSSIYLLLFVSLIGCIIPRTVHHLKALRSEPPRTPANLARLSVFATATVENGGKDAPRSSLSAQAVVDVAARQLTRERYRTKRFDHDSPHGSTASVSAERGYLRETGNLVFHTALVGILVFGGVGGGFGFTGQRVIVEGQTFVNSLASYDSFSPGRFFNTAHLEPYSLSLDAFTVEYEKENPRAIGTPLDYTADVTKTVRATGESTDHTIRVNEPLRVESNEVYLLGNGYAPHITVRDASGTVVFANDVPFLPQDSFLTSLGIIKVPDGLPSQIGLLGFIYPTQGTLETGAYYSSHPDLHDPVLTLDVYEGDLGIDDGIPTSVYALDTSSLTQLTGRTLETRSLELRPGESAELPGGLGSVTLGDIKRFASFEIHADPSLGWVFSFTLLAIGGLMAGLLVPRRRVWVRATQSDDGSIQLEYAGLARGEDPRLEEVVGQFKARHLASISDSYETVSPDFAKQHTHARGQSGSGKENR